MEEQKNKLGHHKVTYNHDMMSCQVVRVSDNAILYANDSESMCIDFAMENFPEDFWIE